MVLLGKIIIIVYVGPSIVFRSCRLSMLRLYYSYNDIKDGAISFTGTQEEKEKYLDQFKD